VVTTPTLGRTRRHWGESIVAKIAQWSPPVDTRRRHVWIIAVLMALGTFMYYVDQTPLANLAPFSSSFFAGVHDVHRIIFLIPTIYAALLFRVRGSLITSLAFLCVVLPRALLFSPYSDPLARPLLFVTASTLLSLLIATQMNRYEKEKRAHAELSAAYRKLTTYHQRLIESQEQLIQAEKLASLGQLAATIVHEVNNPLSGVLVYHQLLTERIADASISREETLSYLLKMQRELLRSTKLIRNLLDFARQSPTTLTEVNINDVVNRAFDLVAYLAKKQQVQVVKELAPSLPVLIGDPDQLQQVCTNLILNAIQAMPEGGILTLHTSVANDSHLKVEVTDTGCGISKGNMPKLFTPFFSTRREVKGVGLGLSVSYGIVQRHNGRIEVRSKEGEGSTFTVYLPLHREEHKTSEGT
jgi:signal transduction histidine kinase